MASVYISALINASAPDVWAIIRDFNALPDWHPLIRRSRIEQGRSADQVGCVRAFELQDGSPIREQLLGLSDYDYSCTYSILESGMDVENYIATLKLTPVTESNQSFAEWSAEFDCQPDNEADLVTLIGKDVFAAGFDSLNSRFGSAKS